MSSERLTEIYDICPVCSYRQGTFSSECDDCGYPLGQDWATVEVDMETEVIVRTICAATPKQPPAAAAGTGSVA